MLTSELTVHMLKYCKEGMSVVLSSTTLLLPPLVLNIFKHALAVWYCATIYGSDVYMFVSKPRAIIMSWRESKITITYKMFLHRPHIVLDALGRVTLGRGWTIALLRRGGMKPSRSVEL